MQTVQKNDLCYSEALSAQSVLESVEDIATADETPVSEMAQKVLNLWSSLREAYKIPKKERIQQMKEHEREADRNIVKPRPRRLPLYAEKIRDRFVFSPLSASLVWVSSGRSY